MGLFSGLGLVVSGSLLHFHRVLFQVVHFVSGTVWVHHQVTVSPLILELSPAVKVFLVLWTLLAFLHTPMDMVKVLVVVATSSAAVLVQLLWGAAKGEDLTELSTFELLRRSRRSWIWTKEAWDELLSRFDGRSDSCNSQLELSQRDKAVTKRAGTPNKHCSVRVHGLLQAGQRRRVTFNIIASASGYVMLGVQSKSSPQLTPYPGGDPNLRHGRSYCGANGYLYYDGTYKGFGGTFGAGDQVTLQLTRDRGSQTMRLLFELNHRPQGQEELMVSEDAFIVANLYAAGDSVEIVRNEVEQL